MHHPSGYQCQVRGVLLRMMTLLGYNYRIKGCRWGITTSTGSHTPAQCFDPPTHWDTNQVTVYSTNYKTICEVYRKNNC